MGNPGVEEVVRIEKNARIILLTLLSVLLAVFFISCELFQRDFSLQDELLHTEGKGVLVLQLKDNIVSPKTLAPALTMEIGSFDIYGEGPDPLVDKFEQRGITSASISQAALTPGEWFIQVDARNPNIDGDPDSNGTVIGRGETTVQIDAGAVTTTQIEVIPLSGSGELNLVVQWTKGSIADPNVVSSLTAAGSSTAIPLTFVGHPPGNPEQYTYNNPNLEAGYYFLILQFLSGGDLVWGTAEAVRIVAGELTEQIFQIN